MRLFLLSVGLVLVGCAHRESTVETPAHALAAHSQRLADACVAADWDRALGAADEVRADEARLRPSVAAPQLFGMVDDAIPLTETAATHRERRSCETGAAAMTLAASRLDGDDAEELQGWLRRMEADADYRDFDAARRDVDKAEAAWRRVRPQVDPDTAATIDAAFASYRGAIHEQGSHVGRPMRHAVHAALDALRGTGSR